METIRLGARLRAARKAAGFKTSKNFLKEAKIPASTYSQHESGARIPDDKILKFYSKVFSVNFDWLKEGKGLPYTQQSKTSHILEEELLDLTQFKSNSLSENHAFLITILQEMLSLHANKISSKMIKKIATDTIKIYETIVSTDASTNNKKKLLRKILNNYKNEINI